jgi:hypothetical protein
MGSTTGSCNNNLDAPVPASFAKVPRVQVYGGLKGHSAQKVSPYVQYFAGLFHQGMSDVLPMIMLTSGFISLVVFRAKIYQSLN